MANFFVGTEAEFEAFRNTAEGKSGTWTRCANLEAAVTAATEKGSTILVQSNTYGADETQSATLTLSTADLTVKAYGENVDLASGLKISGDGISVSGFNFTGAATSGSTVLYAIEITGDNTTIAGNTFDAKSQFTNDVIRAANINGLVFEDNKILSGLHHALNLSGCSNVSILDNTISGVDRSGIQFAGTIGEEIRINNNVITLVKEEGDRVDADDAAIVFSGEWHGDASNADLQMTGNTISVSGSGISGKDGNDYGISGIYFGNTNTILPSMAGVSDNSVSASGGANGIKYDGEKTVDVPGVSVSADSDSSLVLLPEENVNGGVIFNGGVIEGNGANAGKILIDPALCAVRAAGDVVTIDGVEYTVGTNLFGSYADASASLADVTTVAFSGNVTEDIAYDESSRLTLVGNGGTFSGALSGSGLLSVSGFVFDAEQDLGAFAEGTIFSSCTFDKVNVGGASVEKSILNGEVSVEAGKITDCKGSAELTVTGAATIENSSFNSVVLSADANFSDNRVGTLVYTGSDELTLVQNNEVTTIIAPALDKATAEKLSAANPGAKFYSKDDLAANEAVVGFDQLPVAGYFVNGGKIYKVGKTAFGALESLNGNATGLKTVTVNVEVADGATLYGDATTATVYTFNKNTSLNGVTINGKVQIAGNMTINDLTIANNGSLVVEKNSVLMLGGTITADTLGKLELSASGAKIQFLNGTRVIGLTDASWFTDNKADINQVNGTIYIDCAVPSGFDALKFVQVAEVAGTETVINSNKDLAPIKLADSYSSAVTMNLTSSTASEGDLILGDATFSGLTINATGLARFDGTVTTTTLDLVNNGGWIRGEGENEAAKFDASGTVNITNSNKLSIDLAADGQTVTLVNNAGATLDGKISARTINFTNNGTITSLVLVGDVTFNATKLGSTFENITIGEEGNAATAIVLPGANFATTEDSYINGTITLFNDKLGLKIGKGVYAQTITLNGANVIAAINEGTLAFEDGVTAKDVTLQYTVNLMNGAKFQGMEVGTTAIDAEALKVALSITSDGSAKVTGNIANANGGIAISGDLISTHAVTASEAVAVTGSIEAADITAGKTVAISGDASVSGKISAKDSVSINGNAVLGGVDITKDEAANGVLNIGGAGSLDLSKVTFTGFDSTAINAENVETTASGDVEITDINVKNISTTSSITAASVKTNGKIEAGSIHALDESGVSVDAGVGTIKLNGDLVNATSVSAGSIKIGGAVTGAGADITATKDAATYADGNIEIGGALGAEDAAVGTVTADGFIKLNGDVYAGDMTANGGKIEFFGTTFVAEDVKGNAFYGSDVTDSTVTIKSGAFEYIDLKNATLSFTEALTITGMTEEGNSIDVKSLKGKVGAISVVGNIRVQDGSIQAESIDAANIYSAGLAITVDGAITLVSGEASGNIQCASVSATEINNAYRIEATNGDITVGVLGGALEGKHPYLKNGGKLTAASTISSARDILAGEIDGATKITAGRRVEVGSWLDGADGAFTGGSILGTKDGISAETLRAGNIGSADSAVGFVNVSGDDKDNFNNGENPVFAALYSTGDVYAKQISASGKTTSSIYIAGNVTITEPTVDGGISASGMVYVGGNVTNAGTITAHDIVIKGTLESAKSIVVTGGKIDIQKLGSVVNPNGDAINAELASEDSNLGFTADSVVEGNIRFGSAADTLDLGNLKSFSGTIYMGGVSNADAYDTIKVGSSVFAEGTGIALNKVGDASNVNLAIEGGSLDLGNGTIETSGDAANVKLDLATLSNGTLSGAKGDLALELGNTTLEKVTIGKNVSIEVQAGATAVLKDSVITANAPQLTIAEDATLAVEMAKADDAFVVSKDADDNYVAEGTLELRKGVITLKEDGAIGNIVLNGGDTKLILESGAYTLANEALALTAGTMDVNSGARLTVAEGKLLSVDSARLDVSEGTLSITKGGTLALSGSAILMASKSETTATDATVKLSGSAKISTGTLVMNGGTLEIENASSYLSGFTFNTSEAGNNVQVNLTDSSVTVKKDQDLANTAFSGNGVAKMVLETSNYDAYTGKKTVELGAISIDGIDVSLMQNVDNSVKPETLVLSVNGALALSGNFSVTADELNLAAGGSVTVTVTADTTTDKAMFNVGSYTDFTSSAITINASAEEGFSANLKYVLASGDHTDLFKIGSGFEGYSINYKDGYTILASNVTPAVSVTLGEQTVAEDGSYVYAGTVTMDGPSEITKAYCTINGVETALDVVDGSFSVVLDPTAAQFGEFTVTVEASNELGNVGIGSATGAVADMTAPTISISGLAQSEDGYVFTGKLLLADNVAVTGYVFQYYLGDAASAQTVQIAEDGSFSITLDASAPNYSLNFVGQASDAAGNSTELVQDPVAVKDVTAPVLGDTFQAAVNRNQAVFSWDAASDNVAVTGYRLTVNGTVYELGADALSYTLDNLASGSYEYTLEALDAAQNVSDVKTGAFRVDTVKSDIDGNGIADLLFHNEENGAVVAWMDGEDANSTSLGNVDSTWNMIGTGDFNGDGKADILWQKNEGNMVIWNDGNDQKVVDAGFAPSNEWQIVGIGDFSGDGNADILWRNIGSDNGCIGFWGDGADEKWQWNGIVGDEWAIAGVGDFNGDGKSDILWHDQLNGGVGYWGEGTDQKWVLTGAVNANEWQILGVGDFDGNGTDDILWQNQIDGTVGMWGSGSDQNWQSLAVVDKNEWTFAGVADLNGNGMDDMIWRNNITNDVVAWSDGVPAGQFIGNADKTWKTAQLA